MKRFIATLMYAAVIGSFAYALASSVPVSASNLHARIDAQLEAIQ